MNRSPEPAEAYDGFLGHLNDANNRLRVYEPVANFGPRPGSYVADIQYHQ